ncbi:MAG TPA: ShlB/FhaC/HecB family hemolysin secretion/activation protein [Burkholderiaceae bacterium]|nr:ShlB/FhaC/HecB family hemolysin secretion/activation protein [Burkholderiaceae bacterium]
MGSWKIQGVTVHIAGNWRSCDRFVARTFLLVFFCPAAYAQKIDPIEAWLRLNGGGKRDLYPTAPAPAPQPPATSTLASTPVVTVTAPSPSTVTPPTSVQRAEAAAPALAPAPARAASPAKQASATVAKPSTPPSAGASTSAASSSVQPSPAPVTATPVAGQTTEAVAFQVRQFKVTGNSLLPDGLIQSTLASHRGSKTLDGVNAAVEAVKSLYQSKGYAAVVVRLPEQTIEDGTVHIDVTEGKLGQVLVSGQNHFSRDNILASVPSLKPGTTPNLVRVDTEAQLANENPAKNIRIVFQPGMQTGQVDALVSATEQHPQQWTVSADNTGRSSQGSVRAALSYQHANVADKDHVAKLRLETAVARPADNLVVSGSYRVPLYGHPASVEFTGSYSNARNRATPTAAGDLNFAGQGTSFGARYQWNVPRSGETRHQFAAGMDLRHYNNTCTIGNLGSDGCGTAGASVGVRPVAFSYIANNPGLFNAGVHLSGNIWPGGRNGNDAAFEASRPGAAARYWVLRGNWQSSHSISEQSSIGVRASAQQTPHALVSAEQFGIGGAATVRGYLERELVGDQGLAASLEWTTNLTSTFGQAKPDDKPGVQAAGLWQQWFPDWGLPSGHSLHGSVFLDAGQVSNRLGTFCMPGSSSCSLAGLGVGLQWAGNRRWLLRTDLARALKAGPTTPNGDARLHVSYSLMF